MKKLSWLSLCALGLMSSASFAASNPPVVELDSQGWVRTPFVDQEGNPISAMPVKIDKLNDREARLTGMLHPDQGQPTEAEFTASVGFSTPLNWSATAGVIFGSTVCHRRHGCAFQGVLVEGEYGLSGGAVSFGIASRSSDPMDVNGGFNLKATLLHTWNSPADGWEPNGDTAVRNQTYFGSQTDIYVAFFKFSAGLLYLIDGPRSGHDDNGLVRHPRDENNSWLLRLGMAIGR